MSNRTTFQDGEKAPESRMTPDFSKFNVCDSFCKSTTDSKPPAGEGGDGPRIPRRFRGRFLPGWANGIFKSSHPYSVTAT